jgi:uncharacterized protein (UPF0332 family)
MSPVDFLVLARELAAGNRETEWRSAVSRAYYAAFHTALAMAVRCGFQFGKSSAAHEKIAYCLEHCGEAEMKAAGVHLGSLRIARNKADYELENSSSWGRKYAESQVSRSENIISVVSGKENDRDIRRELRAYARDILGLTVVGGD